MKSESERGPIGSWLVRERARLNLSAAEVARKAGMPEASYRAIEAGRWMPRGDRLAALEVAVDSSAPDTKEAPRPEWAEELMRTVDLIAKRLGISLDEEETAILGGADALLQPLPDDESGEGLEENDLTGTEPRGGRDQ